MKKTINRKRYDSERCEVLGSKTCYNNGNEAAYLYLLRASDNALLVYQDARDTFYSDFLVEFGDEEGSTTIDDFDLSEAQELRCRNLGLITIV